MTNKIVILQNSVELYEHYINDERWERTLSFPKGGLTYLISNGTIKFYAYEDYFYRNCLISMQLPIHIVDEAEHIDGEYDDIPEIHEILDDIFPTNDIDRELSEYLKIRDAELTYQPLGDYVTTEELDEVLEDYYTKDEVDDLLDDKADKDDVYTKDEADERFQPIGDYVSGDTFSAYTAATDAAIDDLEDRKADASALTRFFDDAEYDSSAKTINFYNDGNLIDQIDARPFIKDGMVDSVSLIQLSGDTYLHIVFNTDAGKEPIDINLGDLFNADNYYTKQQSDDRFQDKGDYVSASTFSAYTATTKIEIDKKLDESAYTEVDLSNYYNKQETYNITEVYNKTEVNNIISAYTYSKNEIDDKIASGGTFDPSQYYNKDESDTRFALKREIPSLSGYATQQWVLDKHYVTESTIQQYITNLQQQINSIVEAVSGCCSQTGETIYRWITLTGPNDFICSGTTKHEKQQRQQSTDGLQWENVSPAQYREGAVLETDSPDCGYTPEIQYRWKAAPTSDYLCSGTSKYYKVFYEQSTDGGQTWVHVEPEQTKRGDLIEANSTDCGYIAPQYRWYTSQQEYICSGTAKLEKQYYQVSTDGGQTWANVSPVQTRSGAVIETQSADCGYEPTNVSKYLTFIPSENGTFKFTGEGTIPNTASYSLDSGATWTELASGADTPTIPTGTKIMWKGNMTPVSTNPLFGVGSFSSSGRFVVEGNPMSLLYGDNFASQRSLSGKKYAFCELFNGSTGLTSIENMVLPATTLSPSCYNSMFENCVNLTTVPSDLLPATGLTDGCYTSMFKGCESLTTVPKLNATTMTDWCYDAMFADCKSLVTAPALPATTLDYGCYHLMFSGCTSLENAPALPATTLKDTCYSFMFTNCKALSAAPVLPARTLVYQCYQAMFQGCTNLGYIKCLATSINDSNATTGWVKNVASAGTFVKSSSMNGWSVCDTSYYKGIPCNWTIQNA